MGISKIFFNYKYNKTYFFLYFIYFSHFIFDIFLLFTILNLSLKVC